MEFFGENFRGLLTCNSYCPLTLQTITEKTFAKNQKGLVDFMKGGTNVT